MTVGDLEPPIPEPAVDTPTSWALLRYYRGNALQAWPRSAYEVDTLVRPLFRRTSLLINRADDIRRVLIDNADAYARTRPTVRILRPLLGRGLFLATDSDWRHQRRTVAPAFAPKAARAFAHASVEAIEEALPVLASDPGTPADLFSWLQHLALDVAGRALFSLSLRSGSAAIRRRILRYGEQFGRPEFLDFFLPLSIPGPRDIRRALFSRGWFRLIDQLIAERDRLPRDTGRCDVYELLRAARHPDSGAAFTETEIRDQVATLLVAGHETTAVALFWACYLLAQASCWQDRIAAEAALLDLDAAGAAEAVPRLAVARAVFEESMRLYPPAFVIVRLATRSDCLDRHTVAPGAVVMIAPWVLHRHTRLWQRPGVFDPSRFLPGAAPPERFSFLPFGAGPRVCVGASLAMTEGVLVLASLFRRYRVSLSDPRPVLPVAVVTTQPDRVPLFRLLPR